MHRFIFRFFVIILTILSANLITTAISDYLVSYKHHMKPVAFTFLGMGIIVLVFYPLFTKLEEWVKKLSVKAMKSGKSLAGRYAGLLISFALALAVLFYFYARMWYGIDFLDVVIRGEAERYF